ncbi:MgtE intracellular N domain protein [uncultured archaeon]|nr:MgtE intracellular N domain protein [uncultured archaeon]
MRSSKIITENIKAPGPLWTKEAASNGTNRVSFFSQLQGKKIVDRDGNVVGKLTDLSLRPGEALLEISRIVYTSNILGEKVILPISSICSIDGDIRLDVSRDEIPPGRLSERELLVTETILDKQIVDIDGLKVVRVNDVLLAQVKRSLCLVAVDVGFKGILRRLGLSGLSHGLLDKLPNHIIPWSYIDPLDPSLRSIHLKISRKTINDLHPADIADILEDLNNKDRLLILDSLGEETAAEAMEEVNPEVQATMVKQMDSDDVADILENMNPDDAADLLGMMSENKASEVLNLMGEEEAKEVKELMRYSDRSAGSLMTTEYIAVPSDCRVPDVFMRLRRSGQEIDMIYYVYVLSAQDQLLGVISLRDLLLADPAQNAGDVMKKEVISVLPTSSVEEATNLLSKYDFLSVPVVDQDGKMLGIVTFDDALDEIIPEDLKKRLPWNYHKLRRVRGAA